MDESVPIFTPSMEEFQDFKKYMESIEHKCKSGICKIIPPAEWKKSLDGAYDNIKVTIPTPIEQIVSGEKGAYQVILSECPKMTVKAFRKMAEQRGMPNKSQMNDDLDKIERLFWKSVRFNPPIYGADMSGSLFPIKVEHWNMNYLDSILYNMLPTIPGITAPYLYFGMWKAMFAWHVEDMNLFSINYMHFGEPKSWYCIPPQHGPKFERLAQTYFPELYKSCPEFIRHKTTLISPTLLQQHNIPYLKFVQKPGEIVVTFPCAYHCGFSHGFNCAESVNFALDSWIEFGKKAHACKCDDDTVKFDMDAFMSLYNDWKEEGEHSYAQEYYWEKRAEEEAKEDDPGIPSNEGSEDSPIKHNKKKDESPPKKSPMKSPISKRKMTNFAPKEPSPKKQKTPKNSATTNYVSPPSTPPSPPSESPVKQTSSTVLPPHTVHMSMISPQSWERLQESSTPMTATSPSANSTKKSSSAPSLAAIPPPEITLIPFNLETSKLKLPKKKLTDQELAFLENHVSSKIPERAVREKLAQELGWTPQGVYGWFRRRIRGSKNEDPGDSPLQSAGPQELTMNTNVQSIGNNNRNKESSPNQSNTHPRETQTHVPLSSAMTVNAQSNTQLPFTYTLPSSFHPTNARSVTAPNSTKTEVSPLPWFNKQARPSGPQQPAPHPQQLQVQQQLRQALQARQAAQQGQLPMPVQLSPPQQYLSGQPSPTGRPLQLQTQPNVPPPMQMQFQQPTDNGRKFQEIYQGPSGAGHYFGGVARQQFVAQSQPVAPRMSYQQYQELLQPQP